MSRVPPASYTPPPSCPFSTRNLLLTKDRPGRSSHRRIESALHFVSPLSMPLRAHYAPVITIRPLPVHLISFFFSFISIPLENAEEKGSRRTRQEYRTGAAFIFFCSSTAPLCLSSCFLYPFETKLEEAAELHDRSSRGGRGGA